MKKYMAMGTLFLLLGGCATTNPDQAQSVDTVGDMTALLGAADQAYAQGKWPEAEADYRKVITQAPNDGYAYLRLGNTLLKQSRLDEAAQAYTQALHDDINKSKAYQNLAMIRLLQAETALTAELETIPANDGSSAQVKHMLYHLKKITRVSMQDVH